MIFDSNGNFKRGTLNRSQDFRVCGTLLAYRDGSIGGIKKVVMKVIFIMCQIKNNPTVLSKVN